MDARRRAGRAEARGESWQDGDVPAIHVALIDATSGTLLGEAELPAEQLPESFTASTTLHLGGGDWHVEHAEPMTRAEYVKSGRLEIHMRKIERVDPNEILFSLPTIENALPPMEPEPPEGAAEGAAALREDDWRQVELVAGTFAVEIAGELEAIRAIHQDERRGAGFAKLHVRERIPQPLAGVTLRVEDVRAALGSPVRQELAVGNGRVAGGFAFAASEGFVYGRQDGGAVVELGLANAPANALVALFRAHGLVLVDWCGADVEGFGS